MPNGLPSTLLIDRENLSRMLGGLSVSQIIRMERAGRLAETRVRGGERAVRYNLEKVKKLISEGSIA